MQSRGTCALETVSVGIIINIFIKRQVDANILSALLGCKTHISSRYVFSVSYAFESLRRVNKSLKYLVRVLLENAFVFLLFLQNQVGRAISAAKSLHLNN